MAFGGKWVTDAARHTCPVPKLFGAVVNKVGEVWECGTCHRRWQIIRTESGFRDWRELPGSDASRKAVLDELAARSGLVGEELALWRYTAHGVLVGLEELGQAPWMTAARPADTP